MRSKFSGDLGHPRASREVDLDIPFRWLPVVCAVCSDIGIVRHVDVGKDSLRRCPWFSKPVLEKFSEAIPEFLSKVPNRNFLSRLSRDIFSRDVGSGAFTEQSADKCRSVQSTGGNSGNQAAVD